MRRARAVVAILLIAGSSACAPSLPPPSVEDAVRATETWPDATLADLQAGHSLFLRRCAGCHHLPDPRSRTREEWLVIAPKMTKDARMNASEAETVTRYLICMSESVPAAHR